MTYGNGTKDLSSRVWTLMLVGLTGFIAGGLVSPLAWVYGQRGAELGTVILENDKVVVRH